MPTALTDVEGRVDLEHVAFSYRPDQKLIEDLNLAVKPGERVAIVGPTGCGKTTVINLLMRFYDVDAGSISVEGDDIRQVTRKSLRFFLWYGLTGYLAPFRNRSGKYSDRKAGCHGRRDDRSGKEQPCTQLYQASAKGL